MRKLASSLLFLGIVSTAAQTVQWASSIGGAPEVLPGGIAVDPSGNVAVVGSFRGRAGLGTGTVITATTTNDWIFVAKYAPNGDLIWAKASGSTNNFSSVTATAVAADAAGNLYIGGSAHYYTDTLLGGFLQSSAFALFVAKLDSNGNLLWLTNSTGTDGAINRLVVDAQGRPTLLGAVTGMMFFGDFSVASHRIPPLNGPFYQDSLMAMLTPGGAWINQRAFDFGGYVSSAALGALIGTNVVYGGLEPVTAYWTSDQGVNISYYYYHLFFGAVNGWSDSFGGEDALARPTHAQGESEDYDVISGLAGDRDGNIYISGGYSGSLPLGSGVALPIAPNGGPGQPGGAYFAKFDSSGKAIWAQEVTNEFPNLLEDNNHGFLTAGTFSGTKTFGSFALQSEGGNDVFVVDIDNTGTPRWATSIGGFGDDTFHQAAAGRDGAYLLGKFTGAMKLGTLTLTNTGSNSLYLAKVGFSSASSSGGAFLNATNFASLGTFNPTTNVTIDLTSGQMSGGATFTGKVSTIAGARVLVFAFSSFTLNFGVKITFINDGTGSAAVAFLSQGDMIILGKIDASGHPGVTYSGSGPEIEGKGGPGGADGQSGPGVGTAANSVNGLGGAGGGYGGEGGSGGAMTNKTGVIGGVAYNTDLSAALLGGSGGGSGSSLSFGVFGSGGGGGGAVQLGALGTLIITGSVIADGGIGGAPTSTFGSAGGGGGGSGGAVLIQARDVMINSGAIILATGGQGGQPSSGPNMGGGGGGGGSIVIAYHDSGMNQGSIGVAGGAGGLGYDASGTVVAAWSGGSGNTGSLVFAKNTLVPANSRFITVPPWWMFHRDAQHTGRTLITGPGEATQKWAFASGSSGSYSSPAIAADGTIYFAADNLYAVNSDGIKKWSYPVGSGFGPASSPAIATDGTIYVGSYDFNLYAVNPDGTKKWASSLGGIVYSSPVIGADGMIYAGSSNGKLYALRPDGTQSWAFATGSPMGTSPAIGADGTVYVGSQNGKLYAVKSDGTQKWAFQTGNPGGYADAPPSIGTDGAIYVGSDSSAVFALNPDGTKKWALSTGNVYSCPAIGSDGSIYVTALNDSLVAISPSGTNKWTFQMGKTANAWSSPAVGGDGTIYVGSEDHNVYAINSDGTQKWSFQTGGLIESSPAIGADGTIYIASGDGVLHAIGPGSGSVSAALITLSAPRIQDNQAQVDFAVSGGPLGSFTLLQAAQVSGPWMTNASATLTTKVSGTAYRFTVSISGSMQFYRVQSP